MTEAPDLLLGYRKKHDEFLNCMASNLEGYASDLIHDGRIPHVDRVSARAKSPERFVIKALKQDEHGNRKYDRPYYQIQDQIGLRIIVFYLSDIKIIEEQIVNKYFRAIEKKDVSPDDQWKFGYFGQHHILLMPSEIIPRDVDPDDVPECFELQVKTLFQHAWSEANHDIAYKPLNGALTVEEQRKLAYTAAQAWGADQVFDEMLSSLRASQE